jgi:hypothetical protein
VFIQINVVKAFYDILLLLWNTLLWIQYGSWYTNLYQNTKLSDQRIFVPDIDVLIITEDPWFHENGILSQITKMCIHELTVTFCIHVLIYTTTCVISVYIPLKLWVRTPFMPRCTRYNIIWYTLSVTCDRLVVFSRYSGFLHQ